jgi:integrase
VSNSNSFSADPARSERVALCKCSRIFLFIDATCSVTRVDIYHEEDVTKTEAGMRTIPLGALVINELKAWKLRTKFNKPDDLVFPNKKGGYVGHDNMVKRKFNPLFDQLDELHAKDPQKYPKVKRFNWHALRHCWKL